MLWIAAKNVGTKTYAHTNRRATVAKQARNTSLPTRNDNNPGPQPADIFGVEQNRCRLLLYLLKTKHVSENFGGTIARLPYPWLPACNNLLFTSIFETLNVEIEGENYSWKLTFSRLFVGTFQLNMTKRRKFRQHSVATWLQEMFC